MRRWLTLTLEMQTQPHIHQLHNTGNQGARVALTVDVEVDSFTLDALSQLRDGMMGYFQRPPLALGATVNTFEMCESVVTHLRPIFPGKRMRVSFGPARIDLEAEDDLSPEGTDGGV